MDNGPWEECKSVIYLVSVSMKVNGHIYLDNLVLYARYWDA